MASWMKRFAGFLAYAIAGESKAYGFTLVIWATGTATIGQHGYPDELRVLLFVLGALSAFLVTIAAAFPDYKAHFHRREEPPATPTGSSTSSPCCSPSEPAGSPCAGPRGRSPST